jgi:flagellar biosynthetic protein FliP
LQAGEINSADAIERAGSPLKNFMLKQVNEKELQFFVDLKNNEAKYEKPEDIPIFIVIPAFMLSEIKIAFQMGLLILLPFLVIDMLVASILMALGMFMLPPPTVALPFKLMVFVLVDGWILVVKSLVESFQG